MKEFWNVIQAIFAAVGGWLGYFLGGNDGLIYALLAFCVIDLIQILFLLAFRGANLTVALSLAGREIVMSILFVIPIFFLYSYLHRLFRYD